MLMLLLIMRYVSRHDFSVDKRGGVFQLMASVAEVRRLFFADGPGMRLVAVLTIEACLCHMKVMLSTWASFPWQFFRQSWFEGFIFPCGWWQSKQLRDDMTPLSGMFLWQRRHLSFVTILGAFSL
jgi:hypothetical protein